MTVDEMRVLLGLDDSIPDAAVVDAYIVSLEDQPVGTAPVLSVETAKLRLRITSDAMDADLGMLIMAAQRRFEKETDVWLTPRQEVHHATGFGRSIDLYRWPVNSITSISYADQSGESQLLDISGYHAAIGARPVRIVPAVGASWPACSALPGAVRITYQAGFSTPDLVPADIIQSLLMLVAHYMRNQEAATIATGVVEMPFGVRDIMDSYRLAVL